MLTRPTTEQVLIECARELMASVLPSLSDETAQVCVVMLDTVLRNMAVRAAHEIAWMAQECLAIEEYATAVLAVDPGASALREALEVYAQAPRDSLHLDAMVERYCQAGKAFSAALEVAVAGGRSDLVKRGEELLDTRGDRETEVMAGWSPTGR